MNRTKALIINAVITVLVILMAYGFYLGAPPVFHALVYILAAYGFVHFVVDSYGLISAPVPDKPPKPRKFERKTKMDGTLYTASEMLAERMGFEVDQAVEVMKEDVE